MTLVQAIPASGETASGFTRLRVKAVIAETADASSIVFETPDEQANAFRYKPGQFLTLRVPVNGEDELRCYSLASSPATGENLKVTVKRVADGRVSNWLLDNLGAGDNLLVMPPKGIFCLQEGVGSVVLFAAGSGITPVISILKQVLLTTARKVKLVYANRDRNSIIFREELERLRDFHKGRFELVHRLDTEQGILTAQDAGAHADPAGQHYLCGPAPFMQAVKDGLRAAGVPDARILMESFDLAEDEPATEAAPVSDGANVAKVTVRYRGADYAIEVPETETVHAAAKRQGLNLPFSCKAGFCGLCIARVTAGQVSLKDNLGAISDGQIAEGLTLTCQALVRSAEATVVFE